MNGFQLFLYPHFFVLLASTAHANIYQWEYASDAVTIKQSAVLGPQGAGVYAAQYISLDGLNLTKAFLYSAHLDNGSAIGTNFTDGCLAKARFVNTKLTNTNFANADAANAIFDGATLTGADFTNAKIQSASFYNPTSGGFTTSQLYSTASYQIFDLSGTIWSYAGFAGLNFAQQNLTDASFANADLTNTDFSNSNLFHTDFSKAARTGANFTNAHVKTAIFYYTAFTAAQLATTADYKAHDLSGIDLRLTDQSNADFTNHNLTDADLYKTTLTNANKRATSVATALLMPPTTPLGATVWGATYSQSDYETWRSHFGQTAGSGAAFPSIQVNREAKLEGILTQVRILRLTVCSILDRLESLSIDGDKLDLLRVQTGLVISETNNLAALASGENLPALVFPH